MKNAGSGDEIKVYNPPPKRKTAYAITIMEMTRDEGLAVEIFWNHRLSENLVSAARLLAFLDTYCSLVVYQVICYFFSAVTC